MGVLTVAKAKKGDGSKTKASDPTTWRKKPLIVSLRGSEEFKAWLQDVAAYDRQSVSGLVERALVSYARTIGYREEAPER